MKIASILEMVHHQKNKKQSKGKKKGHMGSMILSMKEDPLENPCNLIGNTKKLYPSFKENKMNTLFHWM
jgi:hypothetical protein